MVEIITASIAALGLLLVALVGRPKGGQLPPAEKEKRKRIEEDVHRRTSTPASPGGDDLTLGGLVSLANKVGSMDEELKTTNYRLARTESRLGFIESSYEKLYDWSTDVIENWDEHRLRPAAPRLPSGLHRPGVN